jgi:hypothetical protein
LGQNDINGGYFTFTSCVGDALRSLSKLNGSMILAIVFRKDEEWATKELTRRLRSRWAHDTPNLGKRAVVGPSFSSIQLPGF